MKIIPYEEKYYEEIRKWWGWYSQVPPEPGHMVENGTFILTDDDELKVTLTCFMTQSKKVSFLEGFCAKPGIEREVRRMYTRSIWNHCLAFLREQGFKAVMIMSQEPKLTKRYAEFGMLYSGSVNMLGRDL